jgi:hypothetical protein
VAARDRPEKIAHRRLRRAAAGTLHGFVPFVTLIARKPAG